jgi:hypothetical protein
MLRPKHGAELVLNARRHRDGDHGPVRFVCRVAHLRPRIQASRPFARRFAEKSVASRRRFAVSVCDHPFMHHDSVPTLGTFEFLVGWRGSAAASPTAGTDP